MADNTDLRLTLEAWADIVIKNWIAKIMKLQAYDTMALSESFGRHVVGNSNGVPERVEFAFMFYGRFVDMGVGKGKGAAGGMSRDQKRIVKRQLKMGHTDMAFHKKKAFENYNDKYLKEREAKPWYSSTLFAEVQKLQAILAEKYAYKAAMYIVENLEFKCKTR